MSEKKNNNNESEAYAILWLNKYTTDRRMDMDGSIWNNELIFLLLNFANQAFNDFILRINEFIEFCLRGFSSEIN